MAYNEFAYFYDEFNGEADYEALYAHIKKELEAHGIHDGILADLGCGTGELTLMLTQAGYDMIGIDQSEEMLCSSSTSTVPSGVRCPPLTPSTTSRTWTKPSPTPVSLWKKVVCSCSI